MMMLFNRLKQFLNSESNERKDKESEDLSDSNNYVDTSVHRKQLNITENDRRNQVALLTPREHEIYLLLLEGFSLKESAKKLSIKYSTANTHTTGIYKKLKVNTRAELIINYRGINEGTIN